VRLLALDILLTSKVFAQAGYCPQHLLITIYTLAVSKFEWTYITGFSDFPNDCIFNLFEARYRLWGYLGLYTHLTVWGLVIQPKYLALLIHVYHHWPSLRCTGIPLRAEYVSMLS